MSKQQNFSRQRLNGFISAEDHFFFISFFLCSFSQINSIKFTGQRILWASAVSVHNSSTLSEWQWATVHTDWLLYLRRWFAYKRRNTRPNISQPKVSGHGTRKLFVFLAKQLCLCGCVKGHGKAQANGDWQEQNSAHPFWKKKERRKKLFAYLISKKMVRKKKKTQLFLYLFLLVCFLPAHTTCTGGQRLTQD